MILSNIDTKSIEKQMDWGLLNIVVLGEYGRGRKELRLPCDKETTITRGLNMDLSVSTTKSGRPKIVHKRDNDLYLLISCQGGYTRRGCGRIWGWKKNTKAYDVLGEGNGADGDAGRIGFWMVKLLKPSEIGENEWIRIRTSGGGYGTQPQWIHLSHADKTFFNSTDEAIEWSDNMDIEFPNVDCDVEEEFYEV